VGPNNAGKSTILDAFKALDGALKYARRFNAKIIGGRRGRGLRGYVIPRSVIPINLANIHSDYRDVETRATFALENGNKLDLIFGEDGQCMLLLDEERTNTRNTIEFARNFPVRILSIPTLGPFEEEEQFLTDEYVARWGTTR